MCYPLRAPAPVVQLCPFLSPSLTGSWLLPPRTPGNSTASWGEDRSQSACLPGPCYPSPPWAPGPLALQAPPSPAQPRPTPPWVRGPLALQAPPRPPSPAPPWAPGPLALQAPPAPRAHPTQRASGCWGRPPQQWPLSGSAATRRTRRQDAGAPQPEVISRMAGRSSPRNPTLATWNANSRNGSATIASF